MDIEMLLLCFIILAITKFYINIAIRGALQTVQKELKKNKLEDILQIVFAIASLISMNGIH